jgi:hypothetical protein
LTVFDWLYVRKELVICDLLLAICDFFGSELRKCKIGEEDTMSQAAADELQRRLVSFAIKIIELAGHFSITNNHSLIANNHSLFSSVLILLHVLTLGTLD